MDPIYLWKLSGYFSSYITSILRLWQRTLKKLRTLNFCQRALNLGPNQRTLEKKFQNA